MEIKLGDVLRHKATLKRCVVIKLEEKNDVVIVRDEDNNTQEYYKFELEEN